MKLGNMKSGKQILIEIVVPILICAVLSFFTWWAVISLTDPSCTRTVEAEEVLPVNADHVSAFIISAGEAEILITGPRSAVAVCLSEGVYVTVDLAAAFPDGIGRPGTYPVSAEHLKVVLPGSLSSADVKAIPSSISLTFTEAGGV